MYGVIDTNVALAGGACPPQSPFCHAATWLGGLRQQRAVWLGGKEVLPYYCVLLLVAGFKLEGL